MCLLKCVEDDFTIISYNSTKSRKLQYNLSINLIISAIFQNYARKDLTFRRIFGIIY